MFMLVSMCRGAWGLVFVVGRFMFALFVGLACRDDACGWELVMLVGVVGGGVRLRVFGSMGVAALNGGLWCAAGRGWLRGS